MSDKWDAEKLKDGVEHKKTKEKIVESFEQCEASKVEEGKMWLSTIQQQV